MRRFRFGVACILSALWLALSIAGAFAVPLPFHDDFEDVLVGYYPNVNGWHTWMPGVGAYVSNQVAHSPTRAFRLHSQGYQPRCDYVLLDQVPDRLGYQFSIYTDPVRNREACAGPAYYTRSSVPFSNFFTIRSRDGTVGSVYFTGATNLPRLWVSDFSIGQWVTVGAELDFTTGLADLFVSDTLVASGVPIAPKELSYGNVGPVSVNAFAVGEAMWTAGGWGVIYVDDVDLYEFAPPFVEATVDLKPDALKLTSQGRWVTCYIELPADYSVADIAVDSLLLNDVIPAALWPVAIGDYDGDGVPDLMVKFDRAQLCAMLAPGEQEVELTGSLADGTLLVGSDTVRAIP
jgi:hypothetical protein